MVICILVRVSSKMKLCQELTFLSSCPSNGCKIDSDELGAPFIINKKYILYGISVIVSNKCDCHRANLISGLSGLYLRKLR